ncbi:MAG TPA: CsgG/HfaB family protein [Ferruginibacter sp.]|nr:CsgG/HfaB family protein [Ferruginibacter sp.]
MKKLATIALLFFQLYSYAQESGDGNYTVGILPVTSVNNQADRYTSNVQSSLSNVFVEKTRFTVVDRAGFNQIAKERNLQKQEDFLNGSVVEQGKSLGAEYLISGNVNQINTRSYYKDKSKLDYDAATKQWYTRKYQVTAILVDLNVNVQIIDVATGAFKSNKSFSISHETEETGEAIAINNAVKRLEAYFRAWVNNAFPVYMKIIKVESTNRKGLPEKVLIKGGSDVDMAVNKGLLSNNSSELDVYIIDVLTVDGKELKRQVTIGKVRISEVQGEFSICKVRSGAEDIQKNINEGKTLFLKISRY